MEENGVIWSHSYHAVSKGAKIVEATSYYFGIVMEILPLSEAARVSVGGYMVTAYSDDSELSVLIY
jgi:hypothetical protein